MFELVKVVLRCNFTVCEFQGLMMELEGVNASVGRAAAGGGGRRRAERRNHIRATFGWCQFECARCNKSGLSLGRQVGAAACNETHFRRIPPISARPAGAGGRGARGRWAAAAALVTRPPRTTIVVIKQHATPARPPLGERGAGGDAGSARAAEKPTLRPARSEQSPAPKIASASAGPPLDYKWLTQLGGAPGDVATPPAGARGAGAGLGVTLIGAARRQHS
ncbi:hypothetical protein EVAR_60960_1 [Eumeta japonica]|uniref:Uncharacterized protein n=1 Tax=Eumeta variegata TaxID=151549 RepID=A0A4C1XV20_EUMVA|nr:hypothetical protein EVAR_60960_1 [Eumeta japonica]